MFTCVHAVVFSAFSKHHTQCKRSAIRTRNWCAPGRRVRDVTRTRAGVTDETLSRKSIAGVQGTTRMTSQEHASEFTDITRHHTNTSWNHGYKGITENGRVGSHLVPMILHWPLKKKGPKGRRGQEFRVNTYPTVFSRPSGRRVQRLVQIGSEM